MSSDRIAGLHEQASENYLNGDYAGALQAWRDILALDPANEAALDGVRMAAQFVERAESPVAGEPSEIEHELDEGLSVLNGLGAAARAPAPRSAPAAAPAAAPSRDPSATMILDRSEIEAAIKGIRGPDAEAPAEVVVPDASRQSEGIDFGDLTEVEPIPLGAPGGDALPKGEPEGWTPPAPDPPEFGLATAPAAPLPGSAAAVELKRRIADLLAQARTKADAGERDEALAILGRVAILDEDNEEAQQLKTLLETDSRNPLDRVEQAIIEGVQALEADDLDGAEKLFAEALAVVPEHREALHYMETIAERRAAAAGEPTATAPEGIHEDLLQGAASYGELPPAQDFAAADPASQAAVPLAREESQPPSRNKPRPPRGTIEPDTPAAAAPRRAGLTLSRLLLLAGVCAVAVAAAYYVLPRFMGGTPRASAGPAAAAALPRGSARHATAPAPTRPGALSVTPATAEDRAKAVAADIAEGRQQIAAGDAAAAVISFNDALKLEPANADARAGLHEAGEKYKAQKAQQDALSSIKLAFRDGEYASGLRLAYRLPAGVDPSVVSHIKLAGWYDLGIVALRAGDCREAQGHFKEALAIAPGDAEVQRLADFAKSYADAPRDRRFLDFVEALQFRNP